MKKILNICMFIIYLFIYCHFEAKWRILLRNSTHTIKKKSCSPKRPVFLYLREFLLDVCRLCLNDMFLLFLTKLSNLKDPVIFFLSVLQICLFFRTTNYSAILYFVFYLQLWKYITKQKRAVKCHFKQLYQSRDTIFI